ncbi:transposase [Patescibacteria group bacterium]|nr:transposase [Patescibacteria group bacterium]
MITKHRPPHIHPDRSIIFLTARIYGGFSYLAPDNTKQYFLNKLKSIEEKYRIAAEGWVILNNHYHLLIRVLEGNRVSKFIKELHGSTAHFIKKDLPSLVTEYGQVIVEEVTPWDKRQIGRSNKELSELKRRMRQPCATSYRHGMSIAWNSATTNSGNSAPHPPNGEASPPSVEAGCATERKREVLAQFIARYKNRFSAETYRGLKSAITKGQITDPEALVCLTSKDAPIWYQYVDRVIRSEKDYYRHLNYVHQNPVKHGYVRRISDYKWSSVEEWIEKESKEWVVDCFRQYPIRDFLPESIAE